MPGPKWRNQNTYTHRNYTKNYTCYTWSKYASIVVEHTYTNKHIHSHVDSFLLSNNKTEHTFFYTLEKKKTCKNKQEKQSNS